MLFAPKDRGGFNFDYSRTCSGAHWVAVLALVLLLVAAAAAPSVTRGASPSRSSRRRGKTGRTTLPSERDVATAGRS